eukprot:TRINITY_DN58716_c0_g1_i1.p1 TRINITY_DN58716_c0_g1~~TRINITY_DN58716_c0_g1_i1.p1  ORF type:complete len:173 (+),score=25.50 TRINITY_DN58716_c0_g1_i1:61-579(+)
MAVRRSNAGRVVLATVVLAACCCLKDSSFVPVPEGSQLGRRVAMFGALAAPSVANAVGPGQQAHDWFGSYSDPNHPFCRRQIRFDQTTYGSLVVEGADGKPGCQREKDTQKWIIKASYKSGEDYMTFDFSPKGGPSGVVGKWDRDGIVFPDGNKWTRVTKAPPPVGTLPVAL